MTLSLSNIKGKLNYYLILILAFFIPLKKELIPLIVILFFISSLINFRFNKSLKHLWLIIGFYLIGLCSVFYTNNLPETLFNAEIKLSILILPLAFFFSDLNYKNIFTPVLKAFIEGSLVAVIINFIHSTIVYYYEKDSASFFYGDSSYFAHVSYYSYYLAFSISALYYLLFNPNRKYYFKPVLIIWLILIFSFSVIIGSSKAGLISLFFVHLISASYWVIKHKKYKQGLITIGFFTLSMFLVFNYSSSIRSRFTEMTTTLTNSKDLNDKNLSSTGMRLVAWEQAISLIKSKPMLGYGVGDVAEQLAIKYKENQYFGLAKRHLNAHNQFLQITVGSGIFALLYFIFLLFFPFFVPRKAYFLYALFVTITIINFATESMLETQSGVIFFSFMISLFFTQFKKEEKE